MIQNYLIQSYSICKSKIKTCDKIFILSFSFSYIYFRFLWKGDDNHLCFKSMLLWIKNVWFHCKIESYEKRVQVYCYMWLIFTNKHVNYVCKLQRDSNEIQFAVSYLATWMYIYFGSLSLLDDTKRKTPFRAFIFTLLKSVYIFLD